MTKFTEVLRDPIPSHASIRLSIGVQMSGLAPESFERFAAVDGRTLRWNAELERLFGDNNFQSRASIMGFVRNSIICHEDLAASFFRFKSHCAVAR